MYKYINIHVLRTCRKAIIGMTLQAIKILISMYTCSTLEYKLIRATFAWFHTAGGVGRGISPLTSVSPSLHRLWTKFISTCQLHVQAFWGPRSHQKQPQNTAYTHTAQDHCASHDQFFPFAKKKSSMKP